jgi:hypothetical protein
MVGAAWSVRVGASRRLWPSLRAAWPWRSRGAAPSGAAGVVSSDALWKTRVVAGLIVGVLGFGAGVGYGDNHLAWFGERVTADVTDSRQVCGQNTTPRCSTQYRFSASGDDLGWARMFGAAATVGGTVEVDADPLGWVPPLSPACTAQRGSAVALLWWWLAGLGAIVLLRLAVYLWLLRPFRSFRSFPSLRRRGVTSARR